MVCLDSQGDIDGKDTLFFQEINVIIRELLHLVESDPLAIKCVGQKGILESLVNCIEKMEIIKIGVNDYLEKKRLFFSRYSLSLYDNTERY